MIRIPRIPLPHDVCCRLNDLTASIAAAPAGTRKSEARNAWTASTTRRQVRPALTDALTTMAPGVERCMYCGDNIGTDIDHHEPLARTPLRTFDWLNHLLACSTCNSNHKRDQYPTDSAGAPLLIDPTAEDPFDHLLLTLAIGEYHPLTDKGHHTIKVCQLNRPQLTRGREQARRVVDMALRYWNRARQDGDELRMAAAVLTIREQPCADVVQSMLRQARTPNAATIFDDSPDILGLLQRQDLRNTLMNFTVMSDLTRRPRTALLGGRPSTEGIAPTSSDSVEVSEPF